MLGGSRRDAWAESCSLVGVVLLVGGDVVGLALGCCGEGGLTGETFGVVAVEGSVVTAAVGAGEFL